MGVSGCGKSTLGASIASELDCPFLEGDDYHAAAAVNKMRRGEALVDADRWPWLDRMGHALRDAVRDRGCAVAACSALKRAYRDRLAAAVGGPLRFVLLDGDRDTLMRRMSARTEHYMPASLLDSQLATLERPAADEPVLTLAADSPQGEIRDAALNWLTDTPV